MLGLFKFAAKKATKPALYFSTVAALLWFVVDIADGASDRFHMRVNQAKSSVVEPTENVMSTVTEYANKLWASIESNPGPSILAVVLFVMTVVYHKMKGRSTIAALKAGLLKEAPVDPPTPENPIIAKMHRQAIENQMLDTYEKLEKRQKALPTEIENAREALKRAESNHKKNDEAAARAAHERMKAQAYLTRLETEFIESVATLAELKTELNKA